MKNIFKFLRHKTAKITVEDNIVRVEREDGQIAVFEGNKDNYCIEYNTGFLGGGIYRDDCDGCLFSIEANPTDFINGEFYDINNIELSTDMRGKTKIAYEDTYSELFLDLMTEDEKFSDISLQSDEIKVYINGELLPEKERRIFAGYYKRYDGMSFYVIDVVKDLETGGDVVICKKETYTRDEYFTLTREAFCQKVECNGKRMKKYFRVGTRDKISDSQLEKITEAGYPAPKRYKPKMDRVHYPRRQKTYEAYAKDICKWYKNDLTYYQMSMKEKQVIGFEDKKDFLKVKEDLKFMDLCLRTTLLEYAAYFKERFKEGKSIRKYAEEHNLNRGSVAYTQKKLIAVLSNLLEERDRTDGKSRLAK